jgi:hypothetical protein
MCFKNALFLLACMVLAGSVFAQKKIQKNIEKIVTAPDALAHLTFLAADEMRGRDTGSPEIDIAANYLKIQFIQNGIAPVAGNSNGYFQDFPMEKIIPPVAGTLTLDGTSFAWKDDLVPLNGVGASLQGEVVFVGYGKPQDFETYDVRGKIVVALAGSPETTRPLRALLRESPPKNKLAAAHGALALVEVMALPGMPWAAVQSYFSANRIVLKNDPSQPLPHVVLRNSESPALKAFLESRHAKGALDVKGIPSKPLRGRNVAGIIRGTDATLSQQWVVVSAHYDHVGVKHNDTPDSIYNGARDNAIGTVALLETARFLSQHPPKRSVLFVAFTAEEKGLLGSERYVNHPLMPLEKMVFDLNCDGGGYNDTSIATVVALNRTSVDKQMQEACAAFGLGLGGDPAPEQTLYDRSDNASFALKGVPAANLSPGVKTFDEGLMKYYHQPPDEVGSLDMTYLEKFFRAFVLTTFRIANDNVLPVWIKGDKYEEAGKKLYGAR